MKELIATFKEAYQKERSLVVFQVLLLILSLAFLIFSALNLQPNASIVKISYGDIGRYQGGEWSSMANSGGYHDGSWQAMLIFPILALTLGVLHNLLALRIFEKKGAVVAKMFICISLGILVLGFLVFIRLLGEG